MARVHHDAGQLDRRIVIEEMDPPVDDGMRVKPGGWFEKCKRFAEVLPLAGAERIAAGENEAMRTRKFRIRRPKGFTLSPKLHRIMYRDTAHDITDVQEPDRSWLDVIATARADAPPVPPA